METIAGMKELNQKLSHIERSLEGIDKSLELIAKVMNKKVPKPILSERTTALTFEEDEDEM